MNEKQLDKTLRELLENHKLWVESKHRNGERLDLSNADLCEANLNGTDLYKANLKDASLCEADLTDVDLCDADLRETNLHEANICGDIEIIGGIGLRKNKHETIMNVKGQNLSKSNLEGCNLSEANLKGSIISVDQMMDFAYIAPDHGFNEVGDMIFSAFGFQDDEDKAKDRTKVCFTVNSGLPKKHLIGMIDKLKKQIMENVKEE